MRRSLFLLFLFPFTASAWTRTADFQIADRAARLAPHDLTTVIRRFSKYYAAGVDYGIKEEETDAHRSHLRDRIEKETRGVVGMMHSKQPMAQVVARLGLIAHLVGDANNPFHVDTDEALESSHADFEHYFERRMTRFPTVFYGLDSHFELPKYLQRTFKRTAGYAPLMTEEYFRDGGRHTSSEFDDRSTAFGVASICYSHAITDLVNLYYYVWEQSGGDVRSKIAMRSARVIPNAN
jgi:hypothetical protein